MSGNPPPIGFNAPGSCYPGYPGGQPMPDVSGFGGPPAPGCGNPGYGAPQVPGYGVSQAPGYGAPAVPGYSAPAAPGYGAPSGPGYGAPPAPGYGAPPGQGYGAPAAPGYGAPSGPGYGAPPAPGYGAPPGQGYGAPSGPGNMAPLAGSGYGAGYGAPATGGYGAQFQQGGSGQPMCGVGGYPGTPGSQGLPSPSVGGTYGAQVCGRPSIRPVANFNPGDDAEKLRKAMRGIGTDEAAIIAILAYRSAAQRKQIALKYKASFGKDLDKHLKSELSGKFEEVVLASLLEPTYLMARELFTAMDGLGTRESTLIQILVPATNEDIRGIKTAYQQASKRSLESDLKSDTSGDFERVLVSLLQGCRDEGYTVNPQQAQADAEALFQAGENKIGTEEAVFTRILTQRSFAQIREIAKIYLQKYNKTLIRAVEKETSGNYEKTLVAIIRFAEDKNDLFATWLYESMVGAGTRDSMLIRLVILRSELDLEDIKAVYSKKYGKSLAKAIENDTSGDYKRMLIAMVGS